MKYTLAAVVLIVATAGFACTIQQQAPPAPEVEAPARPLPFTGRLAQGDPDELPPIVAMSLSPTSTVSFSYREELTHDEYHIPMFLTALDPVTYVGAPLGDYGVTAFAALSITDGDNLIGDYTAKAYVSKSYTLYSQPTHQELERDARTAVRKKIDQKLSADADRLARAVAGSRPSANQNAK
jgi:hypothetical protein